MKLWESNRKIQFIKIFNDKIKSQCHKIVTASFQFVVASNQTIFKLIKIVFISHGGGKDEIIKED